MDEKRRRPSLILPFLLIGLGIVFLLNNLNVLPWGVWGTIINLWPVLLIAIGLDLVIGRHSVLGSLLVVGLVALVVIVVVSAGLLQPVTTGQITTQAISQPLDGATRADVTLAAGVADLRVAQAPAGGGLISGSVALPAGTRLEPTFGRSGDSFNYALRTRSGTSTRWPGPWFGIETQPLVWDLRLTPDVPLTLKIEGGVGQATVDLSRLKVTSLDLSNGVGNTSITLPRQGKVQASVHGGVGNLNVFIPRGMAASIRAHAGLGNLSVGADFRRQGDLYVSPGFETAADRVELTVEGGIGNVSVSTQPLGD